MSTLKQQRNLLLIAVLSLLAIAHVMLMNHDDNITTTYAKFYDFVVVTPTGTRNARFAGQERPSFDKDSLWWNENEKEKEYFSACLFLDDVVPTTTTMASSTSAFDVTEWLAYHYHVLPLRYLIVAMMMNETTASTTTTTTTTIGSSRSHSIRNVFDKFRSLFPSLTILEWMDEDYMTRPIVHPHVEPHIVTWQERQRIFQYRCVQSLQHYHRQRQQQPTNTEPATSAWTWLAHTVQEYLVVNPKELSQSKTKQKAMLTLQEPGMVLRSLQVGTKPHESPKDANATSQLPNDDASCLELDTWDAVLSNQADLNVAYKQLPLMRAFNTSALVTWKVQQGRRRPHNHEAEASRGYPQLLDVMRIPTGDIAPHDRHAIPLRPEKSNTTVCRHIGFVGVLREPRPSDEQAVVSGEDHDALELDLRPWTVGFAQRVGQAAVKDLFSNGNMNDKLINNHNNNHNINHNINNDAVPLEERCAMLFFGLPRAYDTLVLPSVTKNVLIPNARHNCDVFVHYYYMTAEPAGRKNKGGSIDPTAILKLADAVRMVAHNYTASTNSSSSSEMQRRVPHIAFTHDTDEAFWHLRNRTLHKYRTVKDKSGNYLYFPWKAVSYVYPSSLDNIVKQWHSIESVWNLMEQAMRQGVANYTRVALLRNDVMFVTPIDIYRTSFDVDKDDVEGRYVIIPPFGLYPVNDRLVYGPYHAIKIWATKRFEYIEDHVRNHPWGPGYGMHSELFLERGILTAMARDAGVNVTMNPDICFFRTRADNTAMISDCDAQGKTRGIESMNKEAIVKEISGLFNCTRYSMGHPFEAVTCKS